MLDGPHEKQGVGVVGLYLFGFVFGGVFAVETVLLPHNYYKQAKHHSYHFSLYFYSSSFPTMGFLSPIATKKSFRFTFLKSFWLISSNLLWWIYRNGAMQASATMFRISAAEKYYSLSTILVRSDFERSYSMSFMFLITIYLRASLSGLPM